MKHIAIIGCGPRGLSALENLAFEIAKKNSEETVKISIFDTSKHLGAGEVWNLEQPKSNWMNISVRALRNLPPRKAFGFQDIEIEYFPSFTEWFEKHHPNEESDIDRFPPRAVLGMYLNKRFTTIAEPLLQTGVLNIMDQHIVDISMKKKQVSIKDNYNNFYIADECLLTIGHQPTKDDDDLIQLDSHAGKADAFLFKDAYDSQINSLIKANHVVAFRGMGLSMIDNIRLLTIERGASFVESDSPPFLSYIPSEETVKKIIPYSLDGIFPSPKPIGVEVDYLFKPSKAQKNYLKQKIREALKVVDAIDTPQFLIDSVSKIAAENFMALESKVVNHSISQLDLEALAKRWLDDMSVEHELITCLKQPSVDYLKAHALMALGKTKISYDYYMGQLWRHLQPIMYSELSYVDIKDAAMERIIALDESTKRYSFGPPVESMLQMIALIEADVLDSTFVNNPKVIGVANGWQLEIDEQHTEVNVIINCVLDSPKLLDITSSLIRNLLKDDILKPVTSKLGVETKENGLVIPENENTFVPLSMLGRNCKGSKMGVDAILECFDKFTKTWAQGVSQRLL